MSGGGDRDDMVWPGEEDFDDDRTIILDSLPLVEEAAAPPEPEAVAAPATALPDAEPAPLFRTGLAAAFHRASRRRGDGTLHPETLGRLARDVRDYRRAPERAFPDPRLALLYEALIGPEAEGDEPAYRPVLPTRAADRDAQRAAARGVGFFALMRRLEQNAGDKPRIGRNARLRDRLAALGQDPSLETEPGDLARLDPGSNPPMVRAQFLGLFGPFGALPLNWSEEITRWFRDGDEAFTRFGDIFTARFQELYYRAWADAHAITQFDHGRDDRFSVYVGSVLGNGTPAMQGRDVLSDTVRLGFAGLALGTVKSPVRLQQMLAQHFDGKARIDIEEMVPAWLDFEPEARNQLGIQAASLGQDMFLGSRIRSVSERIRVHVRVGTKADYFRFLPGRDDHEALRAILHWYIGLAYEAELMLWLPQPEVSPAILGESAELGWMACIAPDPGRAEDLVRVTSFMIAPPGAGQQDLAHAA